MKFAVLEYLGAVPLFGNHQLLVEVDGAEFLATRQGGGGNFWAFALRTRMTRDEAREFDLVCGAFLATALEKDDLDPGADGSDGRYK
jgi:hypothetical protein